MLELVLPLISRTGLSPFLLILLIGLTAVYVIEMARHRAVLRRLPNRIHVNGTRGKSSVTRLIAAGLRAGGIRTFAKTTGSAARLIHTDGTEEPVLRRSAPNIREQLAIMQRAAEEEADTLVIECMAVRPDLQKTTERQIVHSTVGVITNVRPDHLEVMGPTMENVALALSSTIPHRGQLFTNEGPFSEFLRARAQQNSSLCHVTTPHDEPSPDQMDGFAYVEIPENVALALDVCESMGVPRATALEGMYRVTPDVGATRQTHMSQNDKELTFVNAFAANDRESTTQIWRLLKMHEGGDRDAILLINNRRDRMRRAVDMAQIIAEDLVADWYVIVGDKASTFIDMAARYGVPRNKLVHMGRRNPAEVLRKLFDLTQKCGTVMGIGNMGGFGMQFVDYIEQERSRDAS